MPTGQDQSLAVRCQRWQAFLAPDAPPGFMFMVRWADPAAPPRPPCWPSQQRERVEWIWRDYQARLERAAWLHDDAVPHLSMITGTEIFAEAFGCRVHRPVDNMPFALPLIFAAAEVDRIPEPELSTSSLAYLLDMADELARRAGPAALLQLVDVQSPMDIAALIWEKSALLTALVDEPEAVQVLAAKVRRLLMAFFDEWFRRYGTCYVAHCPDYVMHGGLTLSEDEIGIVNTDVMEAYFLPELAELSAHFGGLGIHCCATARHQWHHLRRVPGLRLLNLDPKPAPSATREAHAFFRDTCAQWHSGQPQQGAPETWPSQYPPGVRAIIDLPAKTRDEAAAIADRLNHVRNESLLNR